MSKRAEGRLGATLVLSVTGLRRSGRRGSSDNKGGVNLTDPSKSPQRHTEHEEKRSRQTRKDNALRLIPLSSFSSFVFSCFFSLFSLCLCGEFVFLPAGDWPQFRGPGGSSVSEETGLPFRWSQTENVRWKADLPGRGVSCPVIAGGKVYVTACTGFQQTRLHVLCYQASTGKKLWERQLWATANTMCHDKTCMAAPTPVTDGERVYALFACGDLVALDSNGDLLWYRSLGRDY